MRLDHEATARLIRSGDVDYVSFTGSVAGGREVYGEVSHCFIDAGLELGGKDPAYVGSPRRLAWSSWSSLLS